jgi:predicted nuclease with TOPRIM domain
MNTHSTRSKLDSMEDQLKKIKNEIVRFNEKLDQQLDDKLDKKLDE